MSTISPDNLLHLESGFWGSETFVTALELGLFTRLAESGPLHLGELGGVLRLPEGSARDFAAALVARGALQPLADGRYANTAATELYFDRNKPSYIGNLLAVMNAGLSGMEPYDRGAPRRPPAERHWSGERGKPRQTRRPPARTCAKAI